MVISLYKFGLYQYDKRLHLFVYGSINECVQAIHLLIQHMDAVFLVQLMYNTHVCYVKYIRTCQQNLSL